jgi:DnaJ-class molecular chaperone
MSATGKNSCPSCRGRGWKLVTLRRSAANGGGVAERALLERPRIACLACSGSGRVATS